MAATYAPESRRQDALTLASLSVVGDRPKGEFRQAPIGARAAQARARLPRGANGGDGPRLSRELVGLARGQRECLRRVGRLHRAPGYRRPRGWPLPQARFGFLPRGAQEAPADRIREIARNASMRTTLASPTMAVGDLCGDGHMTRQHFYQLLAAVLHSIADA